MKMSDGVEVVASRAIKGGFDHCSGMPDVPGRPTVRDKGGGRGVEVMWNGVMPNNTGSVLYLVQRRSFTGRHGHRQHLNNDDSLTSPWQQIEQVNYQTYRRCFISVSYTHLTLPTKRIV